MNKRAETRSDIQSIEHVWIPMPDGVRLSARIWMPAQVPSNGVPAIFEYIPYRKADLVRARDEGNHPWLAKNGYVNLRVDMRGSGDSEGHMADMYSDDELADARHVIDWIAAQSWCNGRVGMFGTSWGGTASLQASVDAPEALKAAIAVCATHDRYEDDIHHMGGCLLTDTFEWGATLPAILALPPSAASGDDWFERWQDRLEHLAYPVEAWVREEARGSYWRHGSTGRQADRFGCPILAIGGWSDRYSNSVMSLVDACPDKVWGIVGPWGHHYPDKGHPGPAIGFQDVALEWWDHWLKSEANPAPDWPRLRVWLREFDPPQDSLDLRGGDWVQSGSPYQDCNRCEYTFGPGRLLSGNDDGTHGPWNIHGDLRHGQASGDTGYFGRFGGLPLVQNGDDDRALVFETEDLAEDLILYGACAVSLAVETAQENRQICVRLNDVSPDGVSSRVAFAMINLALDENLDAPSVATDEGPQTVQVKLPTQAYRFRQGHRIRLAIASSYWPLIWTSPEQGNITILNGSLSIPAVPKDLQPLGHALPSVGEYVRSFAPSYELLAAPKLERNSGEGKDGLLTNAWHQPPTTMRYRDIDTAITFETQAQYSIDPTEPTSAACEFVHRFVLTRPDGVVSIDSKLRVTSTKSEYLLDGTLIVKWQGKEVFHKRWAPVVPRVHS